jgi:glycosyltransferase involved in cell wall biosynthesis
MAKAPAAFPAWRRRALPEGNESSPVSNRRSVQVLVTGTQRRGAETFGEQLVAGLKDRGWKTELISLATNSGPRVKSTPIIDRSWSEIGRFDLRIVRALRRHLREASPDAVLALGGPTLRYLVLASLLGQRPKLAYVSIGEPLYWARRRYQRLAYRFLLKGVDLVISVSQRTARQLSALGVPPIRIRVAPVGAANRIVAAKPEEADGPLNVLFLGSLSHEKDPLTALEVFARVASQTPARLRLVGAGPLAKTVAKEIEHRQLAAVVEMTGSLDDVTSQLLWADVLLLTSRTEGLPAAVLEAGAAGVPSVAYDVGGVGEAIHDPDTGRLVTSGDLEGLVESVVAYASNADERRRAGQAARELVADRFTIEEAIEQYERLLTGLASERKL